MPTNTRPMQDLAVGDVRAVALEKFSNKVLEVFSNKAKVWPLGMHQAISDGKSYQFPAVGESIAYERGVGDTADGTGTPPTEERTVPVDNKAVISDSFVDRIDNFISHIELHSRYAERHASAVTRELDSRCLRMLSLGARQAARVASTPSGDITFDGGVLQRRSAATVAAGYPVSETGATRLQDDMGAMAQAFQERNIPEDFEWKFFVDPYLMRVLQKDRGIRVNTVADPNNPNRMLAITTELVQGFRVVSTNQLPQSDITTGESAYQGDFQYLAGVAMCTSDAFGVLEYGGGIDSWMNDPATLSRERSWHIGCEWFGGIKWLYPEACGELYCSTSAYTLTDGVYAPA